MIEGLDSQLEEIEEVLKAVAALKIGETKGKSAKDKISVLEDHLLDCAAARADAERVRLWAHKLLATLREEWDEIEGWEVNLGRSLKNVTVPQVTEAKRRMRPDLHRGLARSKWLVDRLSEQISRLIEDEKDASRVYTLITGS